MIKLGSHVGMSGKKMMLGSVEEALSYGANTFMIYTGAPQNTRRKEISIMKYVGATNWFIRGPFLCEGIIIGIIASAISVGISALIYSKLVEAIGDQVFSLLSIPMVPVDFLVFNFVIKRLMFSNL